MEMKTGSGKGKKVCGGLHTGKIHGLWRKGKGTKRVRQAEPEGLPALHHGKVITSLHGSFFLHFGALKKDSRVTGGYTALVLLLKNRRPKFAGFNLIV